MNSLFKSKPKNIILISFTALYTLLHILNMALVPEIIWFDAQPSNLNLAFRYFVPAITPILILLYMLFLKKEFKFKGYILPVAFAVKIIGAGIYCYDSVLYPRFTLGVILGIVCSFLILVATVFMFIGTLANFKYITFLKYGSISYAALLIIALIVDSIVFKAISISFDFLGLTDIGLPVFVETLIATLPYIAIFILTLKKKD